MGLFDKYKKEQQINEEPVIEQESEEEEQTKNEFEFELGEEVNIACSLESGRVVARSEYECGENQYLVCYQDGTGCAVEKWWRESALNAEE